MDRKVGKTFFDELRSAAEIIDSALLTLQYSEEDPEMNVESALSMQDWQAIRDKAINSLGQAPELKQLRQQFNLDKKELAILLLTILPHVDAGYHHFFGQLQHREEPANPTPDLLLSLLSDTIEEKSWLSNRLLNESQLLRWQLLRTGGGGLNPIHRDLVPTQNLLEFLLGIRKPESDPDRYLRRIGAPAHRIITEEGLKPPQAALIQLTGEAGSGRQTTAWWFSNQQKRPLYELNGEKLFGFADPYEAMTDTLRFLSLHQASLYWPKGLEAMETRPELIPLITDWLRLGHGQLLFGEREFRPWPAAMDQLTTFEHSLRTPSIEKSQLLWQSMIETYAPFAPIDVSWTVPSSNYQLQPQKILRVCQQLSQWQQTGIAIDTEKVLEACREQTATTLCDLAERITIDEEKDQLILSKENREHFNELEQRFALRHSLKQSGVCATSGISTLFWGSPGTGKTAAAKWLAHRLKLPLYKADLSKIISKWAGETEKNLDRLFTEAERNNGILFFDEADAIFSRRITMTNNQEKSANLDVSFLLQRMESYQGVLLLATNCKRNMDTAFFRRLDFSIEFTQPGPEERLELWQKAWKQANTPHATIDLEKMAKTFLFSGANINNIVRHTMVLAKTDARPESMGEPKKDHLLKAIKREIQKTESESSINAYLLRLMEKVA